MSIRSRRADRLIATLLAASLFASHGAARADQALSLSDVTMPNAQTPVTANPTPLIPLQNGTYYSGTLTGMHVSATACLWSGVSLTSCDQLVWPKAGDLAVIVYELAASPGEQPLVLLQVGGATRWPGASTSTFPWISGESTSGTAGACGFTLGCAGGTAGSMSPCTSPNGGGGSNSMSQQFDANDKGWPSGGILMGQNTRVMAAWLPAVDGNTQNPPTNQWTNPRNDANGSGAKFCSIDITFSGVTAGTAPPCADPTYRDTGNCNDPCTCATTNDPAACGLPTGGVHAVEIRFENRSGRPASEVKLLPYSCAASFVTANNPGVLYKDPACTQLLWRDGLFSAFGPRTLPFNGCGHGPGWTAKTPCEQSLFQETGPSVPMRTMRLTDLHDNGDGTYSLWTNHFPDAIWYIGLPQKTSTGWTTVPEVPFFVPWSAGAGYGPTDTIEVAGLQCPWRAFDQTSDTHYFAPAAPAAGKGGAPWPIQTYGDCEAGAAGGCPSVSNGVDWQQMEITMDGNPADIADITYIDFMSVPVRLESYNAVGGPVIESTGFRVVSDSGLKIHPDFKQITGKMANEFPANLWLTCEGGVAGAVLQAAGPNQTDPTCGDSRFIPASYPAHASGAACNGSGDVIGNYRAVFERAIAHQESGWAGAGSLPGGAFPGHPGVPACGWIRDWLGAPNNNPAKFDYDFVLQVTRDDTVQGQTSYTATLKGTVTVHNGSASHTSAPLTIVLGTDTYFFGTANTPPILDLTRAIFLAPTPGNMPSSVPSIPAGCTSQSLATLSLMGASDTPSGDPRLSQAWVDIMRWIDDSIAMPGSPGQWFGSGANTNVTALIGRLMGDAYAGFALGFIASEATNPIIPPGGLGGGNDPWPSFGNTYPAKQGACADCYYDDATPGIPFWQTPSGSWWGGALFPANGGPGGAQFWSGDCANRIFRKHYSDIAPPANGSPMCSEWGALIHRHTEGGYSHPIEDRMTGYKAGINGYQFGSGAEAIDINMLKVTIWSGISATTSGPQLLGDLDGDGIVNGVDLGRLLAEWGSCSQVPGGCQSDLNGDGNVDGIDLGMLLGGWTVP
jgi:hypothetical protein